MAPASAHRVDPFDRSRTGRWIAALVLVLGMVAGVPLGTDVAEAQNASVRVTKDNSQQPFSYTPQEVSVAVGGRVTFSNPQIHTEAGAGNTSAEDHPTNCRQGTSKGKCPWNSEPMPPGEGFVLTFPDEGTFTYFCAVHPDMTGTIIVGDGDPSEPEPEPEPEPSQEPAPPPASEEPSEQPSEEPEPTEEPTEDEPSDEPTDEEPSEEPTDEEPSDEPTEDEASDQATEPATEEPTTDPEDDPSDDAEDAAIDAEPVASGETAAEAAVKAAIRVAAFFLWLVAAAAARIAWRRHESRRTT